MALIIQKSHLLVPFKGYRTWERIPMKSSVVMYFIEDHKLLRTANATKIIFKSIPLDIYLLKDNKCPKSCNLNKISENQNLDNKHLDIGERFCRDHFHVMQCKIWAVYACSPAPAVSFPLGKNLIACNLVALISTVDETSAQNLTLGNTIWICDCF